MEANRSSVVKGLEAKLWILKAFHLKFAVFFIS